MLIQERHHEGFEAFKVNDSVLLLEARALDHLLQLRLLHGPRTLHHVFVHQLDSQVLRRRDTLLNFTLLHLFLVGLRLHLVEEKLQVAVRQLLARQGMRKELRILDRSILVDIDLVQNLIDPFLFELLQIFELSERLFRLDHRIVIT